MESLNKVGNLLRLCFLHYGNNITEKIITERAREVVTKIDSNGHLGEYSAFEVYLAVQGLLAEDIEIYTEPYAITKELEIVGIPIHNPEIITNVCYAVSAFLDLEKLRNSLALFNNSLSGIFLGDIDVETCTEVEPEHVTTYIALLETFHQIPTGKFLETASLEIQKYCGLIFMDNDVYPLYDWDRFAKLGDVFANYGDSFSYINFNELLLTFKTTGKLLSEINLDAFIKRCIAYQEDYYSIIANGIHKLIGWDIYNDNEIEVDYTENL